jgi:branched-chain amino acid transport system substrate-binding protein
LPGLSRWPTALAALAALAAFASGCGSTDEDAELAVYLSAPLSGPAAGDGRDIADAARMALADAGGQAGGVRVSLKVLDDAGPGGADAVRAAANARTATGDSSAIAYVGELDSGTTRTSLPITNEADLLQVSPGASAVDLTRAAPGSDQVPDETQPTGSRTFGRVVPADTAQGAAAAAAMAADPHVDSVRIWGAGGGYGDSLVYGFDSVSDAPQRIGGSGDGLYSVSARPHGIPAGTASGTAVYGADAQIEGVPPATDLPAGSVLVSGPLAPAQLPGDDFASRFRAEHDRAPGRFAACGYEAMALALDSIDRADDPLDRQSVIDAFFATSDRDSVLGTYSIDEVGDTTLAEVGAYRARSGGRLAAAPRPFAVP